MGIKNWLGKQINNQIEELPQVNVTDVFNAIKELEEKINAVEDEGKRDRLYLSVKSFIKISKETALEVPSLCNTKEGASIMYNTLLSEINKRINEIDKAIAKTSRTR